MHLSRPKLAYHTPRGMDGGSLLCHTAPAKEAQTVSSRHPSRTRDIDEDGGPVVGLHWCGCRERQFLFGGYANRGIQALLPGLWVYPPSRPNRFPSFLRRCSGRSLLVIMSQEKKFRIIWGLTCCCCCKYFISNQEEYIKCGELRRNHFDLNVNSMRVPKHIRIRIWVSNFNKPPTSR